jgi:SpoVK/Ycf46/Vps4 family AAA+-type ATPase
MFELNIGTTPNNLTHKEFQQLGEMTEGYSGSDIAIAVRDALMEPIRKLRMATHFKPVTALQLPSCVFFCCYCVWGFETDQRSLWMENES